MEARGRGLSTRWDGRSLEVVRAPTDASGSVLAGSVGKGCWHPGAVVRFRAFRPYADTPGTLDVFVGAGVRCMRIRDFPALDDRATHELKRAIVRY